MQSSVQDVLEWLPLPFGKLHGMLWRALATIITSSCLLPLGAGRYISEVLPRDVCGRNSAQGAACPRHEGTCHMPEFRVPPSPSEPVPVWEPSQAERSCHLPKLTPDSDSPRVETSQLWRLWRCAFCNFAGGKKRRYFRNTRVT